MINGRLSDLLLNTPIKKVVGNPEIMVSGIAFDSREVGEGNVFVALTGRISDGHKFISQALASGAVAIVCEKLPEQLENDICYMVAENSAFALARMSSAFFGHPSAQLKLIGVTGTNGKTTVATLLYRLFMETGYPSGLLSTVENRINNSVVPATHTTPDTLSINRLLARMVGEGCS
jgi:UDP-N-acetylmuramoyl-L-alanyl-D-glutamate--2,6-diaminopimelate ligase